MNRPGDRVGPFELVELIAARPLSNLWRAERSEAGSREARVVVLRIAHHTMDSRAMSELRKEYDALRAVQDPRVRKAHGFYAGFGALALEFVDGMSLASVLARAAEGGVSVDVPTVVDLTLELAGALRVVHSAGVVHGRICLDTVRLRPDGEVVITDFALPLERLAVIPPEFKQGQPANAATDQWLLGALVANLILGVPLLGGRVGDPTDGRRDLRGPLAGVTAECPPLGRILSRMLARDPRDRYPDDGMVILDLLAALRSLDGPPSRERLARASNRPVGAPVAGAAQRHEPRMRPPEPEPAIGPAPYPAPPPDLHPPPLPPLYVTEPPYSLDPDGPRVQPSLRRHVDATTGFPATEIISPGEAGLPPVTARANRSWTPTGPELVPAVHEDDTELPVVHAPRPTPPEPPPEARGHRTLVDGLAAFALVLLLAVGAWAILSRLL
ncbi:hypothetical protein LBMAG42_00120 [Deltaproteobacteria bacterium]|nr:hypothetical protein LBMAG42_00120 [Deltaproteobacteria bacterium]